MRISIIIKGSPQAATSESQHFSFHDCRLFVHRVCLPHVMMGYASTTIAVDDESVSLCRGVLYCFLPAVRLLGRGNKPSILPVRHVRYRSNAHRDPQHTCIDRDRACTVRECRFANSRERTSCKTVEASNPGGRVFSSLLSKIAPARVLI